MAIKAESIDTTQRWLRRAGLGLLGVSFAITMSAGWSMGEGSLAKSILYALMMGIATVGAAILLPVIEMAWRSRRRLAALMLLGAWCIFTVGEGGGHLMAIGGDRHQSIATANVADIQVSDRRKSIADQERTIALIEASIAERVKAAAWLSVKTADAWRADIDATKLAMEIEGKRGGCGPKCLDLRRKMAEAEANLALATRDTEERAKLETAKAALANLRETARADKAGDSKVRTQSDNLVRVAAFVTGSWVDNPEETSRTRANFGLEMLAVLIMVIGPMSLIYAGHMDWTPRPARESAITRIAALIRKLRHLMATGEWTDPAPRVTNTYVMRGMDTARLASAMRGGT